MDGVDLAPLEPRRLLSWSLQETGSRLIDAPGAAVTSVVVADFDLDGNPDLAAAVGRDVRLLAGRPNGTYAPPVTIARFNAAAGLLTVADLDADGRPDLVSAQNSSSLSGAGWVRTVLNAPSGFRVESVAPFAGRATGVVAGRINTGGGADVLIVTERRVDVAFTAGVRPAVIWLERRGSALVAGNPSIEGDDDYGVPALVDLTGDGVQEVVLPSSTDVESPPSVPPQFRVTTFAGRLRVLSALGAAWDTLSEVTFAGRAPGVVLGPVLPGHAMDAVFGAWGIAASGSVSAPYQRTLVAQITGLTLPSVALGAPAIVADIGAQTAAYAQQRVVGLGDFNGDGLTDIVTSTRFPRGNFDDVERLSFGFADVLSLLAQAPDASFLPVTVRAASTVNSASAAAIAGVTVGVQNFVVVPARPGGKPAVAALTHPDSVSAARPERGGLELLRCTTPRKAPSVTFMSFQRLAPGPAPSFPSTRVGETWRLRVWVSHPDLVRGAGVGGVYLFRDANTDGVWAPTEELVASGTPIFGFPAVNTFAGSAGSEVWVIDFVVPASWHNAGEELTSQTMFVLVEDVIATRSDANAARPVVFVRA